MLMIDLHKTLSQVDFLNQDGIEIYMINNHKRNLFYKTILNECKDEHCIDIGFGTGLLSFIALDNGAKSITAYEAANDTFLIGQHLITSLNLEDKITLINKQFCTDNEDVEGKVVFHEIVNSRLWGERLYGETIGHTNVNLIPREYIMRVNSFEFDTIEQAFDQVLDYPTFSPGIKFKVDYKNNLQSVIDQWVQLKHFHELPNSDKLDKFRATAKTIANYNLTFTKQGKILNIDDKNGNRQIILNDLVANVDLCIQSTKPQLIFCDFFMKHNEFVLHLKNINPDPRRRREIQFLLNKNSVTTLTQSLNNGEISLS